MNSGLRRGLHELATLLVRSSLVGVGYFTRDRWAFVLRPAARKSAQGTAEDERRQITERMDEHSASIEPKSCLSHWNLGYPYTTISGCSSICASRDCTREVVFSIVEEHSSNLS
jgi:hypothetical protein